MTALERMKELKELLNRAARAYYQESTELMSNREYDALYDELAALEAETGIVMADSPTVKVGYEILSELPKRQHSEPMLSLDKTKRVETLAEWLGSHEGMMSWKLDGLTVVLTYEEGALAEAVTRGNGEIGEVITPNARTFVNLPMRIPFTGRLVLRGEAVIRYSDFREINQTLTGEEVKYKNPRNLCAGSVRQLNSEITARRHVRFYAFSLVSAEGLDFAKMTEQFAWLAEQGFEVVAHRLAADGGQVAETVETFAGEIEGMDIPSDGLVLSYNDLAYGQSLGRTAKFPRHSIAFKWADETAETVLRYIHWSPSRTGLINPVAVFEPVELEGTTVSRASVHNISIMEALELGEGDTITVYKANMIIPQIAENLTRHGMDTPPKQCPVCGGATKIISEAEVKTLICTNPDCQAKNIKRFALMTERDGLNIDGLSEATLEKLVDAGMIREYSDIFSLERYRQEIIAMEGLGEKSYDNLLAAVERARATTLPRYLYSLGIPGIGLANAKLLCRAFGNDWERLLGAQPEELTEVEGIGPVLANAWREYFSDVKKREEALRLYDCLQIDTGAQRQGAEEAALPLVGQTFVITGSLNTFANRSEMKEYIEGLGGRVTGSVTSKTTALINNDIASASGKNKKAKELGVEIISEEELRRRADNAD